MKKIITVTLVESCVDCEHCEVTDAHSRKPNREVGWHCLKVFPYRLIAKDIISEDGEDVDIPVWCPLEDA